MGRVPHRSRATWLLALSGIAFLMIGGVTAVALTRPAAVHMKKPRVTGADVRPSGTEEKVDPPPPVSDAPTRAAGIDDNAHDGPFGSSTFKIGNTFQGPVGDTWYVVFAGQKDPTDHGVGTLRIYRGPGDISRGLANRSETSTRPALPTSGSPPPTAQP